MAISRSLRSARRPSSPSPNGSPPPLDREQDRARKASDVSILGNGGTDIAGENGHDKSAKRGKGLTEGDEDMPDLPKNNLMLVMPAIGLVLFLAALDQTIVTTALPTIAGDLGASPSEYSWVGTAYMLASTLLTPVNGRVSDIIGRKPMLYAAIICFTVFSALCGAAKSMRWLIIARAFQGLGGGSIIGLTSIVVSDIVPLHKRGAYQGYLGSSWGIASVLGPIIGGALTQKVSWRWCFYINLPTCALAFILLLFTLKLNPSRKLTFAKFRSTFDFLGLFMIMSASALLIVGFSQAADNGFGDRTAYPIIIAGGVMLVLAVTNFLTTKRNAIVPARMFKNRTTLFFLLGSLFHATGFISSTFLMPQMFQGLWGDGPIESGIHCLPFSAAVAWMTVVAGQVNSRLRIVRPVAWLGYALAALSFGLFYRFFTYGTPLSVFEGITFLGGLGVGLSLQVPLLVLQAAMPLKDMAATTAAWSLTRNMGGSIGLAIMTAVLNTGLRSRFLKIPGNGTTFTVPESAAGYSALHDLPDGNTKTAVLSAFADSLRVCWIIACAFFLAALILTLFTRSYSLNRSRGAQPAAGTANPSDPNVIPGQPQSDIDLEAQVPASDPDTNDKEETREKEEEQERDGGRAYGSDGRKAIGNGNGDGFVRRDDSVSTGGEKTIVPSSSSSGHEEVGDMDRTEKGKTII